MWSLVCKWRSWGQTSQGDKKCQIRKNNDVNWVETTDIHKDRQGVTSRSSICVLNRESSNCVDEYPGFEPSVFILVFLRLPNYLSSWSLYRACCYHLLTKSHILWHLFLVSSSVWSFTTTVKHDSGMINNTFCVEELKSFEIMRLISD